MPPRTFRTMSCVNLTENHRRLLYLLARGQPVPDDLAPELEGLKRWGWVLQTNELSGVGWAHTAPVNRGVLGDTTD